MLDVGIFDYFSSFLISIINNIICTTYWIVLYTVEYVSTISLLVYKDMVIILANYQTRSEKM